MTEPSAEATEAKLIYADSSALVKLVIEEPESQALAAHLVGRPRLACSRLAIVEVHRATRLANDSPEVAAAVERLLSSTMLLSIDDDLLEAARTLTSKTLRSLDAIHLASALRIEAEELLAYDRRLLAAASDLGFATTSPGLVT